MNFFIVLTCTTIIMHTSLHLLILFIHFVISRFCYVHTYIYHNYLPTGIPDDITDLSIPPDTISACSIVVQWSRPSNDPVCGTVWYTVTISSEGGVMIITDNTTMTSYDVTGLNDNTVYHVSVTASNNAGSSSSVTMVTMTNSNGEYITGFNEISLKVTVYRKLPKVD